MQETRLKELKILQKPPFLFLRDTPCSRTAVGWQGVKKAVAGLPEKTGVSLKQKGIFSESNTYGTENSSGFLISGRRPFNDSFRRAPV